MKHIHLRHIVIASLVLDFEQLLVEHARNAREAYPPSPQSEGEKDCSRLTWKYVL